MNIADIMQMILSSVVIVGLFNVANKSKEYRLKKENSQLWIRPIVRGKVKAPVEFGAKVDKNKSIRIIPIESKWSAL